MLTSAQRLDRRLTTDWDAVVGDARGERVVRESVDGAGEREDDSSERDGARGEFAGESYCAREKQ